MSDELLQKALDGAAEDGFRHGLGVSIRTVEFVEGQIREALPPELAAICTTWTASITAVLRDASAKFTMSDGGQS